MVRIDTVHNYGSDTVAISVTNEDTQRSADVTVKLEGASIFFNLEPSAVKHLDVRITAKPQERGAK